MSTRSQRMAETDYINQFLTENREFWKRFTSPDDYTSNKTILVDMMVSHPGYLIGNAVIAKYLQKIYNAKIVAVVRSEEHDFNIAVARSFCFNAHVATSTQFKFNVDVNLSQQFNSPQIQEKRKGILSMSVDNIVLGDLAYDSYLRGTGYGTIETVDQNVMNCVKETARFYAFFKELISTNNVVATVQGHTVYADFGSMARAALSKNVPVYGRKPAAGSLSIRRYESLDEIREQEIRIQPKYFNQIFEKYGENFSKEGRKIVEKRINGNSTKKDYGHFAAYNKQKKRINRKSFLKSLGMDSQKTTVCIMSQVFSDSPHCTSKLLYTDFYEWIEATLEIIKDIPEVNWLIKEHPYADKYNAKHFAAKLCQSYVDKYDHISFVPDHIHSGSLFESVDVLVSSTGTAGLESAIKRVPCIYAGENFYTGLGFTIEAEDIDDYQNKLKNVQNVEPLTDMQVKKAMTGVYMYVTLNRVECSLLPDMPAVFWEEMDLNKIFSDALPKLHDFSVETDPLYRNLSIMLSKGYSSLMNFDQIGIGIDD